MTTATPAAYAAEYDTPNGTICYGMGDTIANARWDAKAQFMGALGFWWRIRDSIRYRPLDADEASEVAEMLATPWF